MYVLNFPTTAEPLVGGTLRTRKSVPLKEASLEVIDTEDYTVDGFSILPRQKFASL